MASTNKTSLGLNMWEASDKPVRQDFLNDNEILNENLSKLKNDSANLLNWLSNGNFHLSNQGYTELSIDGATYAGNSYITWIQFGSDQNRKMLIGTMTSTNNASAWGKFVAAPKILCQKYVDGSWSQIVSL